MSLCTCLLKDDPLCAQAALLVCALSRKDPTNKANVGAGTEDQNPMQGPEQEVYHPLLPIGPKVVPFWGSYLEFYKVIPKRNYFGASYSKPYTLNL